jgi:protein-tyrosine phosphatase
MKRIKFEKTFNLRDLGGIPLTLNTETISHKLLRSDALIELSEIEKDYLFEYGVRVIIDVRNDRERETRPNVLKDDLRFIYLEIPILNKIKMEDKKDERPSAELNEKTLEDIYLDILDNYQKDLTKVFQAFLKYKDTCILFHCSAGKDRTGIISALLLLLNGVSLYDVIADYEISYALLLPRMYKLLETYPDLKMHIMQSKPKIIQYAIKYLLNKYGSIINYFKVLGFNEMEIKELSTILNATN